MYKKDYIIGIYSYDDYELCETILESAQEFAEYTETSLSVARTILSRLFHNDYECVVINGKKKKVEFINTSENW